MRYTCARVSGVIVFARDQIVTNSSLSLSSRVRGSTEWWEPQESEAGAGVTYEGTNEAQRGGLNVK